MGLCIGMCFEGLSAFEGMDRYIHVQYQHCSDVHVLAGLLLASHDHGFCGLAN
jgi:hypothetical protein